MKEPMKTEKQIYWDNVRAAWRGWGKTTSIYIAIGVVASFSAVQATKFFFRSPPLLNNLEAIERREHLIDTEFIQELGFEANRCLTDVEFKVYIARDCIEFDSMLFSNPRDHIVKNGLEEAASWFVYCDAQYWGQKDVYEADRNLCEGLELSFILIDSALEETGRGYLVNFDF